MEDCGSCNANGKNRAVDSVLLTFALLKSNGRARFSFS